MSKRTLYMETTRISASKSAAEVAELLAYAGAVRVMQDYADGQCVGLTFGIPMQDRILPFKLPINVEPIYQYLQAKHPSYNRPDWQQRDREQSIRIAWRQVLRWVQAQLALIDTRMVTTQQVFLPYAVSASGQTLYEAIDSDGYKQLSYVESEHK